MNIKENVGNGDRKEARFVDVSFMKSILAYVYFYKGKKSYDYQFDLICNTIISLF